MISKGLKTTGGEMGARGKASSSTVTEYGRYYFDEIYIGFISHLILYVIFCIIIISTHNFCDTIEEDQCSLLLPHFQVTH